MSKSQNYQYKLIELNLPSEKLNNFPNESSIIQHMQDSSYSDEILDLRQQLLEEIYKIIDGGALTDHQRRVLVLSLSGATQNEIAAELGITQSAVHKALHGNIDYKNQKKRYGGIVKKLQKISKANNKIKNLLDSIEFHKKNINNFID